LKANSVGIDSGKKRRNNINSSWSGTVLKDISIKASPCERIGIYVATCRGLYPSFREIKRKRFVPDVVGQASCWVRGSSHRSNHTTNCNCQYTELGGTSVCRSISCFESVSSY